MAATPTKAQWRALRRYALAGDKETTSRLLLRMVEKYPTDKEAAGELARFQAGLPLHITESADQRRARLCFEAQHALQEAVRAHTTPQSLACMRTHELRHLQQELRTHLRSIRATQSAAPNGTNAYKKMLDFELKRRYQRSARSRLIAGGIAAATLLVLLTTAVFLRQRALRVEDRLKAAHAAADWNGTGILLTEAETGIHTLMNSRLEPLTQKVRQWQQAMMALASELNRKLHVYEELNAVSTLSLEERANLLRSVHKLPAALSQDLLARWEELCRPEKEELDRQRSAMIAEMDEAVADKSAAELSGVLAQDIESHRNFIARTAPLMTRFNDATVALELPQEPLTRVNLRLTQAQLRLNELEELRRLDSRLSTAHTLSQHTKALQSVKTLPHLQPIYRRAESSLNLPGEEDMEADLRAARHRIPGKPDAALLRAIVDKGPTFSQTYPATPEQVHMMEDVFTSQALNRRIYELTHPSGQSYFADERPVVTNQGTAQFNISVLDPEHSIERSRSREWDRPVEVMMRAIDAPALMRATEIDRATFFISANVPELLSRIISLQNKACPALAKAYLYDRLLELLKQHKSAEIASNRFSPTLQADAADFRKLLDKINMPLSPGCWLQRTEQVHTAEQLCEQWFAERKKRDYAKEMSRNLAHILREKPHYLGYVDLQGTPHIREELPPGARVRYYSDGKLVCTPADKMLPAPTPLSPILAE